MHSLCNVCDYLTWPLGKSPLLDVTVRILASLNHCNSLSLVNWNLPSSAKWFFFFLLVGGGGLRSSYNRISFVI